MEKNLTELFERIDGDLKRHLSGSETFFTHVLSVRDYYALRALTGILSRTSKDVEDIENSPRKGAGRPQLVVATLAYQYADAMLEVRATGEAKK